MVALLNQPFLASSLYVSPTVAERERQLYSNRLWHPLTSSTAIPEGHVQAFELLDVPLLVTRQGGVLRAFLNRCPHRAVALQQPSDGATPCRRLVCPYHGWTYDLEGRLMAAAREAEFLEPFNRDDWPLPPVRCRERIGLVWVALGDDPLPLEAQLDLLLEEAGESLEQPRQLLRRSALSLDCNWKIAHDNTLDDYHVAIAHPTTLHREQGPVRHYRHAVSDHATLLATPYPDGGELLTFGMAPWTHLLLWPDGRLALIQFPPLEVERCRMEIWLLGDAAFEAQADAWMEQLQHFLVEDKRLVEAAQLGYRSGFTPGPAHRLELRILQQQSLYRQLMGISDGERLA
ncbi:MAG: aromatic ring-hydroxylating dioxygenase subunit alpha [Cyanobacteria bacterium M_surface_7_m2_037]|nr:aromatic ring-hydroxylating dioxygenase subunit alpha [Cyanobacteria bacterium M_surface_7_m2_037]